MKNHATPTSSSLANTREDATLHIPGLDAAIDEILKKPEVSHRLKVSGRTLDEWMRSGRVPYFKIGKTVRFRWADVISHLQKNRVN